MAVRNNVLNFHRHKLVPHEWAAWCMRCDGAEGDLPHHCPGSPMDEETRQTVMDGKLDFIFPEGWTTCTWTQRMRIKGKLTP